MSYLFIESRDPFETRDSRFVIENAVELRQRGHKVTLFLVQNGVLSTRRNAMGTGLSQLKEAGVTVLADAFSLRERGIQPSEMDPGVQESCVDSLVDILVSPNTKAIWH